MYLSTKFDKNRKILELPSVYIINGTIKRTDCQAQIFSSDSWKGTEPGDSEAIAGGCLRIGAAAAKYPAAISARSYRSILKG